MTPRSNALYVENMQGLQGKKPKTTRTSFRQHTGDTTSFLARVASFVLICLLCSGGLSAASSLQSSSSQAAPPAAPRMHASPVTNVTVDGSEAMFTTMCALLAAGFESGVSAANWNPLRAQLRERMQQGLSPASVRRTGIRCAHSFASECSTSRVRQLVRSANFISSINWPTKARCFRNMSGLDWFQVQRPSLG